MTSSSGTELPDNVLILHFLSLCAWRRKQCLNLLILPPNLWIQDLFGHLESASDNEWRVCHHFRKYRKDKEFLLIEEGKTLESNMKLFLTFPQNLYSCLGKLILGYTQRKKSILFSNSSNNEVKTPLCAFELALVAWFSILPIFLAFWASHTQKEIVQNT